MSFLSTLAEWFVPQPLQTRESELPDLQTQIERLRQRGNRSYSVPSVNEALGVPAILGAVSLISNTVGSLTPEAYRNGDLILDQAQTPRLIQRPNPYTTPREFYRDTAFFLATRGEEWWWIAKKDSDGLAASLYPVKPWEVVVAENPRNYLDPVITWRDRRMSLWSPATPDGDIVHLTYLPGDDQRGIGPLQKSKAAMSVGVEADAWAAGFFSGKLPSMVGTTDQQMTEEELAFLDKQWLEKDGNLPRWLTLGMTLSETPFDASKAQLTETRLHQVGEVARMFDMPGSLLEFNVPGSSLTYQNEEGVWADFQRRCLSPHYLEPIEQALSDLLPRPLSTRFNLKQLLRADAKTRAEVHKTYIEAGVYGADIAAREEGYTPGNVDFAPVPPSQPAAIPAQLAYQVRSLEPAHCVKCHKRLADSAPPGWSTTCPRCKTVNAVPLEPVQVRETPTVTVLDREPSPLTVSPQITFAAPDLGVMNRIAEETRRANDIQARNAQMLEELLQRDQPIPQVHVDAAPTPEVTVHTDSFVEAVAQMQALMAQPRKVTRTIQRDATGRPVGVVEEQVLEESA